MDPNDGADDNHGDDFVVVIWGIKGQDGKRRGRC